LVSGWLAKKLAAETRNKTKEKKTKENIQILNQTESAHPLFSVLDNQSFRHF
jgi:hypothetical protein